MRFVKYRSENEKIFKSKSDLKILMDRENKTLDSFLDTLSLALAKEFIRKTKEDEEKPSPNIHLYGADLQILLSVSGRIYDYLLCEGYDAISVSYNGKEINGKYNLDIGGFLEKRRRAMIKGRELVL